jgi:hypothetical protein
VVGAHENSESPYGTFDQTGNVSEWNEAMLYGTSRCSRGGCYFNDAPVLHAASRSDAWPTNEVGNLAFRVAQVSQDCNENNIPDECDIDCGATIVLTGEVCSDAYPAPACGQSDDGNGDEIPDECGACCGVDRCVQVIEASCGEPRKYNGDGTTCDDACPAGIPAVTEWGLLVMMLLVLAAGTLVLRRSRAVA